MSKIAEIIKQLAKSGIQTVSLICTVDSVDKDARTVDCTPLDESAPLLGVNLQANQESEVGVVVYPRVGSYVVVGFVAEGSAGVVLLTDDIESVEIAIGDDKTTAVLDEDGVRINVGDNTSAELSNDGIVFNGGDNNGMVKIQELVDKINAIEDDLNSLKAVFSTAWTVAPNDGGAALKGAATGWSNQKFVKTQKSELENTKVKH